MVEHEDDKRARLAKKDWIWRLFLVVQDLLTYVAAAHHFNLVLVPIVANQRNSEVG